MWLNCQLSFVEGATANTPAGRLSFAGEGKAWDPLFLRGDFKAAPSPLRFAKQEASKELGIVEKARWAFNADCVSANFNP